MRQKEGEELSWITIHQDNPTKIQLSPIGVPHGDYKLKLQSIDVNGSKKSTLKEDIITVRVIPVPTFVRDKPALQSILVY